MHPNAQLSQGTFSGPEYPPLVCLVGSTRFKRAFERATFVETLKGKIVFSVGCFTHHDGCQLTDEQKAQLREMHLRKMDIADELLVIDPGGYIGNQTSREIDYFRELPGERPVRSYAEEYEGLGKPFLLESL